MPPFTKLIISMFFLKTCELYEMYSEVSKTTIAHFDQFLDDCPGFKKNNTIQIKKFRAHGNITNMLFDYEALLTEDIPRVSIVIELEKCTSKEALDTCVKLTSLRSDRLCSMLASKHDFWSPLLECTKPPIECTSKKGVFKGTNCSFKMSAFNWFPVTTNYYWRSKVMEIAKESKEIINCMLFSLKVENKKY